MDEMGEMGVVVIVKIDFTRGTNPQSIYTSHPISI